MPPAECQSNWIFLRGLVRESAHWDDFPDRFSLSIPNSHVVLVDLPGNGKNWRLRSPDSISAMMEFVRREALDSLVPSSSRSAPCYLFAISLGAMVALEWLHRHASEIDGAVLVNTSLRSLSPIYQRLSWRAWPRLLKIACERETRARERAILELTSCRGADKEELLVTRVEAYSQHPISRFNLMRQLRAAGSYRPAPNRPEQPLLLLRSLGDRLVDPACSEAIARHWNVHLGTHPWAGHDLPLDDPEWIIAEVRDWLRSLDRCPASRNRFVT